MTYTTKRHRYVWLIYTRGDIVKRNREGLLLASVYCLLSFPPTDHRTLPQFFVDEGEDPGRDDDDEEGGDRAPDRVVDLVLPDRPDAQHGARDERDRDHRKGDVAHEARFDHSFQFLSRSRRLSLFLVFHPDKANIIAVPISIFRSRQIL